MVNKILRKLSAMLFMALLYSCGSATYHIEVGAGSDSYEERPSTGVAGLLSSELSGTPVTTLEGDDSGFDLSGARFHVGIVEKGQLFVSRIRYYRSSLGDLRYRYDVNGTEVTQDISDVSSSGLEFLLGIRLGWLEPYLIVGSDKVEGQVTTSSPAVANSSSAFAEETITHFGLGVNLSIPISNRWNLDLNYSKRKYEESDLNSTVVGFGDVDFNLITVESSIQTISIGLSYHFATFPGLFNGSGAGDSTSTP